MGTEITDIQFEIFEELLDYVNSSEKRTADYNMWKKTRVTKK